MNANQAWIALFRRIPADLQDTLALGMNTGAEIVVQRIVRLDPDFMLIRGRLAGTQDTGRIVVIPYERLTFVAVQRDLKDAEVEAIFGKDAPPSLASLPTTPADTADAQPEPVTEEPAPIDSPVKKPEPASKTALLAKLRERLKEPGSGK